MVMPAMVYSAKPYETVAHFRGVATATDLPVMIYNNPPVYKNDVTPDMLAALADCETVVCFKESSGDTRRFTDLRNLAGDRFIMFAGLDDVIVESVADGRARVGVRHVERLPARGRGAVPPGKARRIDEAGEAQRLVHAAAASGCAPGPGAMHQAVRADRRPRLRAHPPAAPGVAGAERAEVEALMAKAMETRPNMAGVI